MSPKTGKPDWMPQEEWDAWVAGEEERERDLWETVKRHEARAKARKQAEADAELRPKRRRFFGLLPRS